ncbi:MAG: hypothetical protein IT300_07970 [Dehalococcoidia bacterium]|nr:hypothetical protein [Dehalococcoidia bacterium]
MKTFRAVALAAAMLFATLPFTAFEVSARPPAHRPLVAAITEDFCGPWITCGDSHGTFGPATVESVITGFEPLPNGCFYDTHTTTLTFADASELALDIVGQLCPTEGSNFRFLGTFSVATDGNSGRFTGATGAGSVLAFRENGPIHGLLIGRISLAP